MKTTQDTEYYVSKNGEQTGPYQESRLCAYIDAEAFQPHDQVWCEAYGDTWITIADFQKLRKNRPIPPPSLKASATKAPGESDKRITPALILWFFLGSIGVHQFYLGRIGTGITYIALVIFFVACQCTRSDLLQLSASVALLLVIVSLLGDLIRLVTGKMKDGEGNLVTQWT